MKASIKEASIKEASVMKEPSVMKEAFKKKKNTRFFPKAVSLALAAVMALSLAACGKEEKPEEKTDTEVSEYTYVPEYIEIDVENMDLYSAKFAGGSLYFTTYAWDEETQTSKEEICEYSLAEKKVVNTRTFRDGSDEGAVNRNMNSFLIADGGSMYTIENVYNEDYSDRKTFLCVYDTEGSRTLERDITDEISDGSEWGSHVGEMAIDGEGRLYLSVSGSTDTIKLYDSECNYRGEIPLTDSWINDMKTGRDGKVYGTYYKRGSGSGGYCLAEIDFDGRKFGTVYENFPSSGNVLPGIEKDFLAGDNVSVYEYDMASQTYETLFTWLDSDINGSYVQNMDVLEDGRLAVVIQDWDTGENSVALLTRTRTADLPVKTQVVIGSLNNGQDLQAAAVAFNKQSDTYHVSIKSYIDRSAGWTETTYSDAIARLNSDIVSGANCPDIIDLSSVNVPQLAAKGVFEDLVPYLDKSSVLSKNDFLENILESSTYDGVLVGIPDTFSVSTIVGKASHVGEKRGWTLDDIMAYSQAHTDAALFDYMDKSSMLYTCLAYNQGAFIDYKTGKCSFDSDEFKKVLNFAGSFPDEVDYDSNDRSTPKKIEDGDLLLETVYISDFREIQMYEAMFGEPVTFVGYPTMDGSEGCVLTTNSIFGISVKSQNKDGAWAFIENFLTRESSSRGWRWGFSTRKSALEESYNEAITVQYQKDENGELILDENGEPIPEGGSSSVGWGDWDYTYHQTTQEEADLVMELIKAAKPAALASDEIMTIITEEAEPFFQGQKSVDDVVDIIQRRVQLYMDENN